MGRQGAEGPIPAAAEQLHEMFPHLDLSSIRDALQDCSGDADVAAAMLLSSSLHSSPLPSSSPTSSALSSPPRPPPPHSSHAHAHAHAQHVDAHLGAHALAPHTHLPPLPLAHMRFDRSSGPAAGKASSQQVNRGAGRGGRGGTGGTGGTGGRGGRAGRVDRQQAIDALCARCEWADVALVRDVLFESGWDVEQGAALLRPLAPPGAQGHATAPTSSARSHPSPLPSPAPAPAVAPSGFEPPQTGHAPAGRVVHPGVDAPEWALHAYDTGGQEGLPCPSADEEWARGGTTEASSLLQALGSEFPWADDELLRDVLGTFGGDAGAAGGWLRSVESGTQGGGGCQERGVPGWRVDQESADAAYRGLRADAFKASREQRRYAKGAAKAFGAGDHSTARQLSQLASREQEKAQAMHAQAARQILEWRNGASWWELDLHGLHAKEAVEALALRLQDLESGATANAAAAAVTANSPAGQGVPRVCTPGRGLQGPGPDCRRLGGQGLGRNAYPSSGTGALGAVPLTASRVGAWVRRELTVITGVGHHSVGGPTLPSAVQSYLLENRYAFQQPRPGVFTVKPKVGLST